jgi:ferric iron reductase protein FhuF
VSSNDVLLGGLTDLVSFLRWRIGPLAPDELASATLAAEPDRLAAAVMDTAPGRGTEDPQVAASLWWQGYAYRVAGTTLGCWLLAGAAPDPAAEFLGVGISRARPSSVIWSDGAGTIEDLGVLVGRLFADHLDPVAASLRARFSIGGALLHGNVGAGIESALGAVRGADGAPPLDERMADVRAALPAAVTATVELTDAGHRRRACCLWWKTTEGTGRICADCSLAAPPAG